MPNMESSDRVARKLEQYFRSIVNNIDRHNIEAAYNTANAGVRDLREILTAYAESFRAETRAPEWSKGNG